MPRRVLLTGAAGRIGTAVRAGLRGAFEELRLVDREPLGPAAPGETCVQADLRDLGAVLDLMDGIDAVVHLAALPSEEPLPRILDNNVRATHHVLEAARQRGARRIVLASSNHVTGMYPVGARVGPDSPPRPDSFYAVGKVCDEALGRLYADKWGLEVACLRIGSFLGRPTTPRSLATWLSPNDAVALVRRCLTAPDLGFAVLYGVSATARGWWDNPHAERVGYRPTDDAEQFAAEVLAAAEPEDPRAAGRQGGGYTLPERSEFDDPG